MTETDSVTAVDKQTDDRFGVAVAISGNVMAVGSWMADLGSLPNAGSAYVFETSGTEYQPFVSLAAQDGYILEAAEISEIGHKPLPAKMWAGVGDTPANRQYRSILAFDTSSLPDNAVITAAILKIKRTTIKRGDPFQALKPLVVDIRSPHFGDSPEMAASDFQAASDLAHAGTFGIEFWGWLTSELQGDAFAFINLNGTTQFRLRFALDDNDDFQSDFTAFYSGEAAAKYRPVLIVKYTIP